jgi:hypothetical protein
MPIDPRELRPSKNALVTIIDTDRLCGRCRYNLKGLPSNGRCPECGRPVASLRSGKRTFTDNLADAPLFYLKALATGLVMMAGFSIASVAAFLMLAETGTLAVAAFAGVMAIGWWVGVFIVTAQRSRGENALPDDVLDSPKFRAVNRVLQLAWPLAAVAWAGSLSAPAPADKALVFCGFALATVGLGGLVPLSVHLSALAYWAHDTAIGERLRFIAWGIAVIGAFVLAGGAGMTQPSVARGLLYLFAVWSSVGLVIAELVFLWSLVQLAHEALWAVRNAATASDVAQRMVSRAGDPMARECVRCGYDMSGLDLFSRCPECGHLDDDIKRSGLASLRAVRKAAEAALRPDEVVPLEPGTGRGEKDIRFITPIAAGRVYPPKPDP